MHKMDFLREGMASDVLDLMVRLKRAIRPAAHRQPGQSGRV
jgi:hypothetical protein